MRLFTGMHSVTQAMKQSDDFQEQLTSYREAIDAIDRELLGLLAKRADIVQQVGTLKRSHGLPGSVIRPGREAKMLRDLIKDAEGTALSDTMLAALWRIIIGSSTALESPLQTLTLTDDPVAAALAADYFGPEVPHRNIREADLIEETLRHPHAIAVVPYDAAGAWWPHINLPLRVFACLPFTNPTPTHLAIGHVTPEPTGDDASLFYDTDSNELICKEGFLSETDGNAGEHYLGSYALPLRI